MTHDHRTWRLALLICALVFSSAAWAATEKVHVSGSIRLHLRDASTPATDGSNAPVSVQAVDLTQLSQDLRTATIQSTPQSPLIENLVRVQLQAEVTKRLGAKEPVTLPPSVIFTTPDNVDGALVLWTSFRLGMGDDGFCDGSPANPSRCHVLSFDVDVTPVKTIVISLVSEDTSEPLQPFPYEGTFVELAAKLHFKSDPGDSSTHFSIRLSKDDLGEASGEPDFSEALRVVERARDILEKAGVTLGVPGDNPSPFGPLSKFDIGLLSGPYDANLSTAGRVQGLTIKRPSVRGNELTVELTAAKFLQDVRFQAGEGANVEALAVVKKHHGESFRRRMAGEIVRAEEVSRAVYELKNDPYVKDAHFTYEKHILVFTISTRTVGQGIALSAGGGYSPEKNGYGTFAGTLDNLFARGDRVDTSVALGPNIANVSLSATIPETPHPFNAGFHFLGLTAGGVYQFNDKAHYQVAGADLTKDQQKMLTGSIKLGLDSFSAHDLAVWPDASIPHRKRIQHLLTLTPSYEIGLLTTTDRKTQQTLTDGQITAFSAQPAYVLDWDLRSNNCSCGLSELRLQLDSTFAKGGRWLGGDFAYDAAQASGSFELTFGTREPYEYLLRGRAGAGSASRGTPLPRLFQIGGPDYVRGLERGEFTANTLLWQQAEAGPSLTKLWSWIQALRPGHKNPAACADATSPQLPFNLRTSYLALFYDHARVGQGTSLPNVLDQSASASLQGYGAALELGKVKNVMNISLGYGYSPQSQLHRHGVMFVGVTLR